MIHDEHSDSTGCSHRRSWDYMLFLLYQSFVLFSFIFASLNPVLPFDSGVCACIYCKTHGQGWESQKLLFFYLLLL